jgi:hypothetical protein
MAITKVTRNLLSTGIDDQSNATAITIDSSENIGIGTNSGDVRGDGVAARTYVSIIGTANRGVLNIGSTASAGADGGKLTFVNGTNAVGEIYVDPDAGSATNGFMVFSTSNSEKMRIDSSGNVGIGRTPVAYGSFTVLDLAGSSGAIQKLIHTGNTVEVQKYASSTLGAIGTATNHDFIITTNDVERMRIDSSGNVLVGTTTFNNLSTEAGVLASNNVVMARGSLADHQDACAVLQYSSDTTWLRAYGDTAGSGLMVFRVGGGAGSTDTEAMRIDSSGVVLIGKSNNDVTGAGHKINANGETFHTANTTSVQNTLHVFDQADSAYRFYVGQAGTGAGNIYATNTSITAISDVRLKENIKDLETGLSEVMSLKPRRFDWKKGEGSDIKNVAGFIAQEVETVLPDLIGNYLHEELDDAKSVRMGDMLPTLVKAIQEQQTIIEDLKSRIETLEG